MENNYKNILANKYIRDTNYIIIRDTDDLEELEQQWNDFTSMMTPRQQRISDNKSIGIWNMTNQQHYEYLKQNILDKMSNNMSDDESYYVIESENPIPTSNSNNGDISDMTIDRATAYELSSNLHIVGNPKGDNAVEKLKDLERQYSEYDCLSADNKRVSDDECLRIYNQTNVDRYSKLKSELSSQIVDEEEHTKTIKPTDIHHSETVTKVSNEGFVGSCNEERILRGIKEKYKYKKKKLFNLPYFTPDEMIDMGVHGYDNYYSDKPDNDGLCTNISIPLWFASYKDMCHDHIFEDYRKEWISKLTELYKDYNEIKESGDIDRILARKQSILDLGWNPEIPFTYENRVKASERVNKLIENNIAKDIFINLNEYIPDDCISEDYVEEAVNENEHQPVFLIFNQGKTPIVSSTISKVTKSEYTHASISFSPDLSDTYSYVMNPKVFGLVRETLKSFGNTVISVYAIFVDKLTMSKFRQRIKDFTENRTTYDFTICINKIFGVDKKFSKNQYNQVCSTFVDNILKSGNINITGNINLPTPADLYNYSKKQPNKIIEIYNGLATKYNTNKIKHKLSLLYKADIDPINEACKDINTAREFVKKVGELAKKYDANYFIVTDGASGTHNNGNPAVSNARKAQIKWEKENGYDPDEDWSSTNESFLLEVQLPKGYSLRNATKDDFDNMVKWEIESVDKNIQNDPKVIQYIKDDVKESIDVTKMIVYNNETIGMLTTDTLNDGYWYIGEIYLTKEHRGKGIGTALLKNEIRHHNKIKLQVAHSNAKARKLYESLGFEILENNEKCKMYLMVLDKTKSNTVRESSDIYHNSDNISKEEDDLMIENLNDIMRGVNPYSKKLFFHISTEDKLDDKVFKPRIPTYISREINSPEFKKRMDSLKDPNSIENYTQGYENYTTPRVSFSPSINGCLQAIINEIGKRNVCSQSLHVYIPEKPISKYKIKTNKEIIEDGDIFDANITKEIWILEPVKLKYYGSIKVNKVTESPILQKFANNNYKKIKTCIFDWYWSYKPRNKFINESSILNEAKRFPVEFDKDGNLTIYKCRMGNIAFGDELDYSNKLLTTYKNTSNLEGMKYELSRVWFLIHSIDKRMGKNKITQDEIKALERHRATAYNIFKTNLKYVMNMDKDFNFVEYYNNTPFSDNSVMITANTLKYAINVLKSLTLK